MPIYGVVRPLWREAVVDTDANGQTRVNRLTYEICVLEALRERLRSKEIWVVGADATATRTRTCPPTSWRNALPTMLLSGCHSIRTASSPGCKRKCARRCPSSRPA